MCVCTCALACVHTCVGETFLISCTITDLLQMKNRRSEIHKNTTGIVEATTATLLSLSGFGKEPVHKTGC